MARRRYRREGGEVEQMGMWRIGAVLALGAMATGCVSIYNHRGYFTDEILLRSVQPGLDNRQSVERALGHPSFVSQYGPSTWYYIGSNTAQGPFTRPRIFQHDVLAVSFDDAGNVATAQRSNMENVARINPVGDKTPTVGRERTFLEDLFGNIGQVGAAGVGNSGAGGGGGGQ